MALHKSLLAASAALLVTLPTLAQDVSATTAVEPLAPQEQLAELFTQIRENPKDLKANFAYGQLAYKMGKYDEAMAAYERMLIINSDLPRVKLELGLVHMALNNDAKAEELFNEVAAGNPPENVQKNIDTVLAELRKRQVKHKLGGAVITGINFDSNANAAASSGEVDLLGVSIPLGSNSQKASDEHRYAALSLHHSYRLPLQGKQEWVTDGLLYKTDQSSMGNLDTTLKNIGSGPVFTLPTWKSEFGLKYTYTDINLARADYQISRRYSGHWKYTLHPKVQVQLALGHEVRRYRNTDSATTNELRNGQATDATLTTRFAMTPKDMLSIAIGRTQVNTQVAYYDNTQDALTISYMRQLPKNVMMTLSMGHTVTGYDDVETLVNPNTVRQDHQRSYGISFMRPLWKGIVGSAGYTWRDVDSNIQNYTYTNERWSFSLTKGF